jgi:hypothetical protein
MGNYLSCTKAMTNYVIEENLLYELRHVISVMITGLIWFIFIRNYDLQNNHKYIIIPIFIFILVSYIISTILSAIIELIFIDKKRLNKLIDKCITWQNAYKGICESSFQGVCYVKPEIIVDWDEDKLV